MAIPVASGTLFQPQYTFDPGDYTVEVENAAWLNSLGKPQENRILTASYTIKFANRSEYLKFVAATQSGETPIIRVELPE